MDRSKFQRLRPECVRVSNILAQGGLQTASCHELENALRGMQAKLAGAGELDDALTDYVLFPVLQVFRLNDVARPAYVTTAALDLLSVVLQNARSRLAHPQFAMQILMLVTNLFQRQGELLSQRTANEDVIIALCGCIKQLVSAPNIRHSRKAAAEPDPRLVITGTLLATLFEFLSREEVSASRLPALEAIRSILLCENDTSLLRRFLPGLLSNLVRPFSTLSSSKWSSRALQLALSVIQGILLRCLSAFHEQAEEGSKAEMLGRQTWLRTNKDGLLAAFKQLVKAQRHEKQEVRIALSALCISLLEIAHADLHLDLVRLLVSTVVSLQGQLSLSQDNSEVTNLFTGSTQLREVLRSVCNTSISQLPSFLQSPDQDKHERAFSMAANSLALMSPLGPTSLDFAQVLSEALLSSTTVLMQHTKPIIQPMVTASDVVARLEHTGPNPAIDPTSVFGAGIHIGRNRLALQHIIHTILDSPAGLDVLRNLSSGVEGDSQISTPNLPRLWVLSVCLDGRRASSSSHTRALAFEAQLDRVSASAYNAALDVLRQPPMDRDTDWRAQAVALKFIGLRAERESEAFRPELIYALYPILERVACADTIIQEHGVQALQMISAACGYANVSQLVLENADYLINAIGIRLNTFDVRPESASVLQLAINLCGPDFLPYLNDVAESVFMILDTYHGYPLLVRSMFAVLGTILDQAPEQTKSAASSQTHIALPSSDATDIIKNIRATKRVYDVCEAEADYCSTNDAGNAFSEATNHLATKKKEHSPSPLFARILRHAQYFLTYEATSVRHGLLQILKQGLRALRHDQDMLLPVVNDIWPVIVARVADSESHVVIEALNVLVIAIDCVGNFLSSRFEDEWPRLRSLFLQHKPFVARSIRTTPSPQVQAYTQTAKVWAAITTLIASLVQEIDIHPEMEDDLMGIFAEESRSDFAIRQSLDRLNADASWLSRFSRGDDADYAPSRLEPIGAGVFAPLPT